MNLVDCPNCGMRVLPKLNGTCPSCQFDLSQKLTAASASSARTDGSSTKPEPAKPAMLAGRMASPDGLHLTGLKCPDCGGAISERDILCPHCGANLPRNGEPLPGSAPDPRTKQVGLYQLAGWIVLLVGVFTLALGLMNVLFNMTLLGPKSIGIPQIILGLVFLVLGYFALRGLSAALSIAVIIYVLENMVELYIIMSLGGFPPILIASPLFLTRVIFLIPMLRGIRAVEVLKSKRKRLSKPR